GSARARGGRNGRGDRGGKEPRWVGRALERERGRGADGQPEDGGHGGWDPAGHPGPGAPPPAARPPPEPPAPAPDPPGAALHPPGPAPGPPVGERSPSPGGQDLVVHSP